MSHNYVTTCTLTWHVTIVHVCVRNSNLEAAGQASGGDVSQQTSHSYLCTAAPPTLQVTSLSKVPCIADACLAAGVHLQMSWLSLCLSLSVSPQSQQLA